jgi:hypothetical protein
MYTHPFKKTDGIFENISFVEMESSKLINYSTSMCWSRQDITVITIQNATTSMYGKT